MTEPSPPPSALDEYRDTFSNRYDLRRLWRDRQALLRNPRLSTEPSPPLSLSPRRFALTLAVVPMLAIGWATSQVAGLLFPEGRAATPTEAITRAIETPLREFLGQPDRAALRALQRAPGESLSDAATALRERGRVLLDTRESQTDPQRAAAAAQAFLHELRSSALSEDERRHVAARLLKRTESVRHLDRVGTGMMRSFFEGGAGAQLAGALAILATAALFRRIAQRDPRLTRAALADRVYLYYVVSLLFWLTLGAIVNYGVLAFASASDDALLLERANLANQFLLVASVLYVLLHSRQIARALRDDDALPRGAARSVAWRLLLAQLLANLLVLLVLALGGILLAIGAAVWFITR